MTSREWDLLDQEVKSAIVPSMQQPPIKLSQLASNVGGVRIIAAPLPKGISGEIRPDPDNVGNYLIKVNRNDSARRQRFTVAHELAHYFLHRDQIGGGIEDDVLYRSKLSDAREAQANRLAADILMPEKLVDEWIDKARALKVEDVLGFLADKFNVSEAAMKIRLGIK
ncbi:ImmA/IrrE family metallo-endopeptidase [Agrobacterium sp. CMT1]|uniref:ImmA/IrrE family metallo-endopeptidase n=1 Tax=Agrobacterium sp. CMT1 TaxID=3128901 RepID=UPI000DD896F9